MNFEFTESEKLVRESVGSFLAEKTSINAKLQAEDSADGFDRSVWSEAAELGWFEAIWGRDADDIHTLGIIATEIGRTSFASPFITTAASAILLDRAGGARGNEFAKDVSEGKIQLAIIHPRAFKSPVKIEAHNGHHSLSSSQALVGWAESADFLVLPVETGDGSAVVLIDRKAPGVNVEPVETFDNTRSALVQFTNVEIPGSNMFPIGHNALGEALDLGDLLTVAEAVGGTFGALDLTVEYVKERVQFGKAIATFQAVRHGLADVKSLAEGASLAVWDALGRAANREPLGGSVALAKWLTKTAFQEAAIKGAQYHGGMGHTRDSHMQFYYCRAGSLHGRLDSEWNILKQLAENYVEPNFDRIVD